jgi:hypothetical protein
MDENTTDARRGRGPSTTSPAQYRAAPGWGAAPAAGPTPTLDAPGPVGPSSAWSAAPADTSDPSTPYGQPGPPHGYGATSGRSLGRGRPWTLPVVAVAVGLGALLTGGGVGFAAGQAIGAHQGSVVQGGTQGGATQGGGLQQAPGGGTGGFPGGQQDGTQGGTQGSLPSDGQDGTGS